MNTSSVRTFPSASHLNGYAIAFHLVQATGLGASRPMVETARQTTEQRGNDAASVWAFSGQLPSTLPLLPPTTITSPVKLEAPSADRLAAEILKFRSLREGWDGYGAARPNSVSLESALAFVRLVGAFAARLDASLHADGAVILEQEDGTVVLQFQSDGTVVFAAGDGNFGQINFDRKRIPEELASLVGS